MGSAETPTISRLMASARTSAFLLVLFPVKQAEVHCQGLAPLAALAILSRLMRFKSLRSKHLPMRLSSVARRAVKYLSSSAPGRMSFMVRCSSTSATTRSMPTTGLLTPIASRSPHSGRMTSVGYLVALSTCLALAKEVLHLEAVRIEHSSSSPTRDYDSGNRRSVFRKSPHWCPVETSLPRRNHSLMLFRYQTGPTRETDWHC